MHQPMPDIHARSLIFRRRMKSSEARTMAVAPSLGGLMSIRWTGHAMTSLLSTSSTVIFGSASRLNGLACHVDAVDRVRRGPVDDHVDVRSGQAPGVEGHLGRLEAHLLARLLKAATEQGHPRADHPDLPHWPTPRTATAPVADGMYRQDCATPTRTPSI